MGSFSSRNPARPSEVVATFDAASADQVGAVVDAAAAAQRDWAAARPAERATVVGGVAHALAKQTHELVDLIVTEVGKTTREASGEVRKSIEQFHFASQLAYLIEGVTYPDEDPGTFAYTLRTPVGVVAAITPWNFPLSLPARKIAAALAVGNAVVFKPSPVAAAVGELFVQTARQAGVPPEVLQVVHGDEPAAMTALVQHPAVRAVTFTGSDTVGEKLQAQVQRFARLQLELGGRNSAVVAADADVERAVADIAAAAFGQAGQTCTATDQVLVHHDVYDRFRQAMAKRVAGLVAGPGHHDEVSCGPVATAAQRDRLQAMFSAAEKAGARLLARGQVLPGADPDGYWVPPAVYADVPDGEALVEDEVFGPGLSLRPVGSVQEAVERINRSSHGLVASVHTADLGTAQQFARQVACGIVKINGRTTGNGVAPPFGGWKRSSSGAFPEGGRGALDFFTETKSVYSSAILADPAR
jgi:aldehyde dehydrogenase (NAD+)